MNRVFDKPFILKEKPSEDFVWKEEAININWKLYDKIIEEKHKRGILNYPTDLYINVGKQYIPFEKVQPGSCVELSNGHRGIVFEYIGRLWIWIGLRKVCLTPKHNHLNELFGGAKRYYVRRIIYTTKQIQHMHKKFGIVK